MGNFICVSLWPDSTARWKYYACISKPVAWFHCFLYTYFWVCNSAFHSDLSLLLSGTQWSQYLSRCWLHVKCQSKEIKVGFSTYWVKNVPWGEKLCMFPITQTLPFLFSFLSFTLRGRFIFLLFQNIMNSNFVAFKFRGYSSLFHLYLKERKIFYCIFLKKKNK